MNIPRLPIQEEAYKWWALGVIIIGGFMSILDTSIVNIAVPKMMAVFSVNADDAQWILTAYMLTMGVVQPATGYFCDVLGSRRMYLFSLAVFVAGSALCGIAWSNDSMIAFRIFQAIGGGLIVPITMSIVYQVFPPQERNMALGIWGISAMVAPAVGPTLSGYLVEYWDWRLIFTINIPVGIIGYILAVIILRETPIAANRHFDYGGFITSALGLFCLLLALSEGTDEGWSSAYILALFYIALASLVLFVFIEINHPAPLLDLSLFKNWNFSLSTIVGFIGTIGLFGGIFMVPLFMENMRGNTAMQTGLLIFPSAVAAGLMMPVAARLADKFGAKPVVITGLVLLTAGSLPLIFIDLNTSDNAIRLLMTVRGLGLGLFVMPVTVLGMNTVPMPKISRASSLNNAVRQISGSLGIAILTTVLQNRQIVHLQQIGENINTAAKATAGMLAYGEKLFAHNGSTVFLAKTQALALISSLVQRQSYIFAFDDAFLVLAIICGAAILPALLLRPVRPEAGKPAVAGE
ncbi:MAG TPA: DHA2 family efflux MFS transporter permease subunit [Methylomusa anaerophila]|uniref:Multidrug export protein EmrB n=1 Tax=Methylomusa anaerophila TaxID=1930071 RepID=A0A348AG65_9FIRM|nr:DHA2 family efflux MFS transporter permease subunit [Methylomusa anaerophila]BBB90063.1 multidrug export protein EmrB [Methylomusa anaerophila]HML88210.1 DHA2 family efflux MFS transporter permease subunit [Methylomusa anaerophila]